MILQRTRFEVESGEFNLRRAGVDTDSALTLEVPRKEAALQDAAAKAKLMLEKARATSALALEQKRLALKKAERDRVEALRKMRDLQQDKAGITLKAPRSGIVYYGKQHDGAWTTAAVAAKAAVGQGVPVGDLVFTVVDPERVAFRVKVDEKDLHLLSPGLKGRVELSGFPDTEGAIVLESVSPVPRDGKVERRPGRRPGQQHGLVRHFDLFKPEIGADRGVRQPQRVDRDTRRSRIDPDHTGTSV
jgi:multidrug resistance efflux pump